jgi:hypothetical protein
MTPDQLTQAIVIGASSAVCTLVFGLLARYLWRRLDPKAVLDAVTVFVGLLVVLR